MKKYKYLIISILISLGVCGLSALITGGDMDTYKYLSKPPLSPPSVLFPIVWTILFILMGISAYMVYVSKDRDKDSALTVYVIQLIINFFWSIIFFSLKLRLFAFIWIILLSLIKLKKGDYYNDRKNKMWIIEVISLVLFILAGLLTTMNLYYENDIQVLVLGYFFLIHGILELFDPLIISLKIK